MDIQGKQLESGTFAIERWMAYLWADATRNDDNRFRALPEDGRQQAPPELGQLLVREASQARPKEAFPELDPDYEKGVYHGEQAFEFNQPLYVGEEYQVSGEISSVTRKEGQQGTFDIVSMQFDVRDENDELAVVVEPSMVLMR